MAPILAETLRLLIILLLKVMDGLSFLTSQSVSMDGEKSSNDLMYLEVNSKGIENNSGFHFTRLSDPRSMFLYLYFLWNTSTYMLQCSLAPILLHMAYC